MKMLLNREKIDKWYYVRDTMGELRGDQVTNYARKVTNKMETDMFSGDCEESEHDDGVTKRIAKIILKHTNTKCIIYSVDRINIQAQGSSHLLSIKQTYKHSIYK